MYISVSALCRFIQKKIAKHANVHVSVSNRNFDDSQCLVDNLIYLTVDLNIIHMQIERKCVIGSGGTPSKLGYNDQHKLKIWTLRDLKTSEKGV